MKFKAKIKDCHLFVVAKAGFGEVVDEVAMTTFARAALTCFMKPDLVKKNQIRFSGPVGISLYERLKKPLDKRSFLYILEHIVIAAEKIRSNNLKQDKVILDLHNVYINERTKELRFLYAPSSKDIPQGELVQFIENIMYSVTPEGKDTEFITRFNHFLKGMKRFTPEKLEEFVAREDKSVVVTLKKQYAGQSGYMTNKQSHYYDHYDEGDEEATGLLEDEEATGLLSEDEGDYEATGLLSEEDDYEATGILDEADDGDDDYEATGLLNEDEDDYASGGYDNGGYEETGLLSEDEDDGGYEETGLLIDNSYGDTGLLEEEDEGFDATGPLEEPEPDTRYAELYRISTDESIPITMSVFRLGKGYADYAISNNNAVSRNHAEIVNRGGRFFVVDLDSKNHTYINGQIIPGRYETEICDGDRLKLANEEFIFRL